VRESKIISLSVGYACSAAGLQPVAAGSRNFLQMRAIASNPASPRETAGRRVPRQLWSAALLLALAAHAVVLARNGLPELWHLLWSCHLATATLALGLLFGWRSLAWAGFLFHLAIGLPSWLVAVVTTKGTFGAVHLDALLLVTSIAVHLLPLVAGFAIFGIARPPRAAIAGAWAIQVLPILISRAVTPPALNVNLAFAPWPAAAGWFLRLWMFHAASAAACLTALPVVAFLLAQLQRLIRGQTDAPAKGSVV
jgi:hypothetical protein